MDARKQRIGEHARPVGKSSLWAVTRPRPPSPANPATRMDWAAGRAAFHRRLPGTVPATITPPIRSAPNPLPAPSDLRAAWHEALAGASGPADGPDVARHAGRDHCCTCANTYPIETALGAPMGPAANSRHCPAAAPAERPTCGRAFRAHRRSDRRQRPEASTRAGRLAAVNWPPATKAMHGHLTRDPREPRSPLP